MKFNGFLVVGIAVTVAGWFWLVLGSGVDTRPFGGGTSVYNLNLGAMAEQCISLGYTLLIVGTLVSGFQWLKPNVQLANATAHSPAALAARNESPLRPAAAKVVPVSQNETAERVEAMKRNRE